MSAPNPRDEGALIRAAREGDELAFRRLLRNHTRMLEHQAGSFFLPGGDHQDVLQEARIAFAGAIDSYESGRGASFGHYASLCVQRKLSSAVSAARRYKHEVLSAAVGGDRGEQLAGARWAQDDPVDLAVARQQLEAVTGAAAQLTDLERGALSHALVGATQGQAARALGCRPKQVDNARQRMRHKLAAAGISAEAA